LAPPPISISSCSPMALWIRKSTPPGARTSKLARARKSKLELGECECLA
jgi:hypothetical protein